jgi:hypothetical protein
MGKLAAVLLAACAALLALAAPLLAGDPSMLQDICAADYKSLEGREWRLTSLEPCISHFISSLLLCVRA